MTRLRHLLYCKAAIVAIFFLSILQVQLVISEASIESVSIIEKNQIKRVGEEVEFNCKVNNLNGESLLWVRINENDRFDQFVIAMNTNSISKEKFAVKYDKDNSTYNLRVLSLEANDAGYYQCQVLLGANNKMTAHVKLDIERAPEIISNSFSLQTVREGESIELECLADGFPTPNITWKRENDDILPVGNTSFRGDTLKIQSAHKSDRGNYYCTADNNVEPKKTASIKLSVEFAPVVDTPRPRIGQARGYDANLQCHIEANPTPTVTWLKSGKVIATETPHVSGDEFIHVHRISVIDLKDYGRYTCRVENTYGQAETIVELFEMDFPWIYDKK